MRAIASGRRIHRPATPVRGRSSAVDSWPSQEDPAIDPRTFIEANVVAVLFVLAGVSLVLLAATILSWRRAGRLAAGFEAITRGSGERSLEAILEAHLGRVHEVIRSLDELEARTALLERDLKRTFARIGLVRYNPFEDTGGNQSFALALLDAFGDGFIVSSLHSRSGTRVYAKGIRAGRSDAAVSAEEAEALRVAMAAPPTSPTAT